MVGCMNRLVTLRPITPEDGGFLYRIYASTREDELAVVDWDDGQKEASLEMQFAAHHAFYMEQFPRAEFQIILLDEEPIGRLYVDRRENEIRIIDIALFAEHRNKGVGSTFLEDILSEGQQKGLLVRIHVEQNNPALQLYKRLGFQNIGENGIYYLMEWSLE